jgi:uncharacterized protein
VRDLAFNAVLAVVEIVALRFAVRKKSRRACAAATAVAASFATGAAFVFAEDPFRVLRFAAYALFAHGPLLLFAFAAVLRRTRPRSAAMTVVLALSIGAVAYYAFRVEPFRLEVETFQVRTTKLKRPLRIAVLADFQTDRIGDYERRVAAELAALKADLVLLPGDYLQEPHPQKRAALRDEFRALFGGDVLKAPLGAIAVRGDCEHQGWEKTFAGLPVKTADATQSFDLGEFVVTALAFKDSGSPTLRVAPTEKFQVVVGHRPDFALGDVPGDLLIAGHTHGGQVRLPFIGPLITLSEVPRAWAAGRTALPGGRTLIVSRGTGMERHSAPRLRFLCRPQIVVAELLPEA